MRTPFAALLLLAVILLTACSDPQSPPGPARGPAATAGLATVTVDIDTVPREVRFDGILEAIDQATVSAQTSGRVVELPFDVGDYVEKDAVIVRFTSTEQRARLDAATAALAEARARLAESRQNLERIRNLHERQLVARADLDRASADFDSARARTEAAEAALAGAREALDYTTIRAPYAGIVVTRHAQVGESVQPGQPLMTGLSLEHLRAVVDVPQQHIGPLRREGRARVILPNGESLAAEDLRIPPGADPATHSFRVLVTLPSGEHGLFPGTLVKVAFVSGVEERLLIPAEAVVRRGELTGAYVVDADGIAFRHLRVGTPAADGRVPVLAGLAAGERVAVDPVAAAAVYRGGA